MQKFAMQTKYYQGVSKLILILWYEPLKYNWNTITTP